MMLRSKCTMGQLPPLSDDAHLQEDNENIRGKLEESKHQLQGNEQMIKWLNNQVRISITFGATPLSG